MNKETYQMKIWSGEFGKEYTDRNSLPPEEMDDLYLKTYGVTRTEINNHFLSKLDRSASILEVGANIGTQLTLLQKTGFINLFGIELQKYAVRIALQSVKNINIFQGSAFDIPFADQSFDLVYTSGVLIHLHPKDIIHALKEIYRCTKKYIWGFEHYSEKYEDVNYRGHDNLLWNADYANIYLQTFPDLVLIEEKRYKYLQSDNVDSVFLLQKRD